MRQEAFILQAPFSRSRCTGMGAVQIHRNALRLSNLVVAIPGSSSVDFPRED